MRIRTETIAALRLFEGLSLNDLQLITRGFTFNLISLRPGRTVRRCGERCGELLFIMKGSVRSVCEGTNVDFVFEEELDNRHVIEPYSLFGVSPYYRKTYRASTYVEIVGVDKRHVVKLIEDYDVFRLNFLNYVCSYAYHTRCRNLTMGAVGAVDKIIQFVLRLSETDRGDKLLKVKKTVLASLIGEPPVRTSAALGKLKEMGLVDVGRGWIVFHEAIFADPDTAARLSL